ncbi:uncharacterized protein LOC125559077 [Nematostella vectensis]|uniref:uncharacterized protein LOC125559077 n=1 Tax=Nematostella vectensis TaxID=45351 RepID=UPI0020770281|nr:uncharacterized protein LOC125559077 [Nematostella vectensis]
MKRNQKNGEYGIYSKDGGSDLSNNLLDKDKTAMQYSYNLIASEDNRRLSGYLDPIARERGRRFFGLDQLRDIRKGSLPVLGGNRKSGSKKGLLKTQESFDSLGVSDSSEVTSLQQPRKVSLSFLKTNPRELKPQLSDPIPPRYSKKANNYDGQQTPKTLTAKSLNSLYSELPGVGLRFQSTEELFQANVSSASRKTGLSAAKNKEIMHTKMRKKAVVDSTDESHYQRQFLRILNKRF